MRKLAVVAASAVLEPSALPAVVLAGSAIGGVGEVQALRVSHSSSKKAQAG